MKKIVALVLSLVMVLGLATTAFAALPIWSSNGSTANVDVFDGTYNTKVATGTMTFTAAKAPVADATTLQVKAGNIAYYTFDNADGTDALEDCWYVMVDSIPADAVADNYVLVKVADPTVKPGAVMTEANQSAAAQTRIMKKVYAVNYWYTAELFTSWGTLCGQYKAPKDIATQKYASFTDVKGVYNISDVTIPTEKATLGFVLIGNDVYAVGSKFQTATDHLWVASAWNEKTGAVTEFTCDVCKTVAKVINSSVNAPAGYTVENLNGTLIAFQYTPGVVAPVAPSTDKVESAETFDAGIAMYVGMSVMAAAGSAVVLKKKD